MTQYETVDHKCIRCGTLFLDKIEIIDDVDKSHVKHFYSREYSTRDYVKGKLCWVCRQYYDLAELLK